jgi:hypothetical protein
MSNNGSFVFSNGLNIKVFEETKYNNLYDEIDNKIEKLNGVFPVISINSNLYTDNSVLFGAENLILANTSKVAFVNTEISPGKVYNIFADNNSQIFTDFNSNLSSIKSVKSLGNNLINFPHLTVKNTKILQPQVETNYIYNDRNWKPITICSNVFNDFYPNNQHLTSGDLILSPKFLNNGDIAFWGMNQNQKVLKDINLRLISGNAFNGFEYDKTTNTFTATDTSLCGIVKIMDVVNSLPRDLNGHSLNIIISGDTFPDNHRCRPGYVDNVTNSAYPFVLSGFFGGEVNITGDFWLEMPTEIKNCDNVTFEKWHCWTDKGACLKLTNCKNISFLSSYIESWNIINDVAMDIDNSSVYITSSNFHFTSGHVPLYWKGKAVNNSQVFIDGTCNTWMETKIGDTGLHTNASGLNYFPKFQLSDNSMCTWLDDSIPVAKLGLYSQSEFEGITSGLTKDVYIGNHLHQNVPPQFLPPTVTPGGSSSGGSTGGSGSEPGSGGSTGGSNPPGGDPTEDLYTIDNTLPVGATFYWPRAFTIPFTEVSGISGVGALPGSTYFFYPPATEITSDYQKSASSVLIPFMTRSNSFR